MLYEVITETNGILLPGVTFTPGMIGNDFNLSAPGLGFVFGLQDDIRNRAAEGHWLTEDTLFNGTFATKYTTSLILGLTLEPIRDLKIDLTGTRTYSLDQTEYFKNFDGEPRITSYNVCYTKLLRGRQGVCAECIASESSLQY